MTISFTIPIAPRGQMRSRSTSKGWHYKAKEQTNYEDNIAGLIKEHIPDKPLEGALRLTVFVHVKIPESKPKWWKEAAEKGFIKPESTPDCDNILKNIADIMEQTGFYHNDKQIYSTTIQKFYSVKPRWDIWIARVYSMKSKKEYDEYLQRTKQ